MDFPKQFEIFARIDKQIYLQQNGLAHLQNTDQIIVVCLEGDCRPITGDMIQENFLSSMNSYGNSIWICKRPIYNKKIKKSIVYLKINIDNKQEDVLKKTHFLCSLISNIMICFNYEQTKLKYLVNIQHQQRQQAQKRRQKVSMLVGMKFNQSVHSICKNVQDFSNQLKKQGIQNDVSLTYPQIYGYVLPYQISYKQFINIVQDLYDPNQAINKLMHGPILTSYAFNLVVQINQTGRVNIQDAQQQLQISDEYVEYLRIIEQYHKKGANRLGTQPQNNINDILKQIRKQTEDEFKCRDGVYLKKLNEYIQRKQMDIKAANEELHQRKNIKILQKQSQKCIKRIREKDIPSHSVVQNQLNKLDKIFAKDGGGQNKQKLFSQYLKIFTPNLYRQAGLDTDPESKIQLFKTQNKVLEEQIKQLQRKGQKCCIIM